jgi:hypothetical protein
MLYITQTFHKYPTNIQISMECRDFLSLLDFGRKVTFKHKRESQKHLPLIIVALTT